MNMRIRTISIIVLGLGILGLLLPLFLPPAPVLPDWTAFIPYVLLGVGLAIAHSPGDLRFLLVACLITVGGGTWAYWDSMRFNRLISWQAFGMVSRYVPLFQTALALPAVCFVWRHGRVRGKEDRR